MVSIKHYINSVFFLDPACCCSYVFSERNRSISLQPSWNFRSEEVGEKHLLLRLLKNVQMQGTRDFEE